MHLQNFFCLNDTLMNENGTNESGNDQTKRLYIKITRCKNHAKM